MTDRTVAERSRRWRRRRREGLQHATAEVPYAVLALLIEAGHLKADQAEDPRAVGAALIEFARNGVAPDPVPVELDSHRAES